MKQDHPIAAISTPPGQGAIALIRCSGENIISIVDSVFRGKGAVCDLVPQQTNLGWIVDPATGEKIDQVMLTVYRFPRSYTGEDMVEISTHGGFYVSSSVLKLLVRSGCRMAGPGEFTRRAFLNGKMNLLQAEAVREIVSARTAQQRRLALFQIQEDSSRPFFQIKERLERQLMLIEASIDFPDEEHVLPWNMDDFQKDLQEILKQIQELGLSFQGRRKIREGLLVPIAGMPNAGKSTLFNWFCKKERVIVDPEPGTTRDAIEEELEIEGMRIRLVDTAGIRLSADRTEAKGIKKTREFLKEADILLWIHDITERTREEEKKWIEAFSSKPVIHINNKIDLLQTPRKMKKGLAVSLKQSKGLKPLLREFKAVIREQTASTTSSGIFSIYQAQCLNEAETKIRILLETLENNGKQLEEILAIEIRDILESFDPLTGRTSSQELLNRIFSEFCIGK